MAGSDIAKRKRHARAASGTRQVKRPRELFDEVKGPIQVGGESEGGEEGKDQDEEYVDGAVIDMMNAASRPRTLSAKSAGNIEVVLSTSGSRATAPSGVLLAGRSGRLPYAKRLSRQTNSIEFIGFDMSGPQRINHAGRVPDIIGETPQRQRRSRSVRHRGRAIDKDVDGIGTEEEDEEEEVHSGFEHSATLLGSPELHSSVTRRRASQAVHDIYNVPEDSDPLAPTARRLPTAADGLALFSRVERARELARKALISRNNARLASIHEKEAPATIHHDPLSPIDEEGQEFGEIMRLADGDEESESEASKQDSRANTQHATENSTLVAIQIHPNVESRHTMAISSDHVNNMRTIMGWKSWTGAGQSWDTVLLHPDNPNLGGDGPARTQLGKGCFRLLRGFKDLLDRVPSAADLPKQTTFLTKEEQAFNKTMSSVEKVVTKICNYGPATSADSGNQINTNPTFREALAKDLSSSLIPMLVLALRSAFTVGITEDAHDSDLLPAEGVFTWSTVQYLLWITGWMLRLEAMLTSEFTQRSSEDNNPGAGRAASQEDTPPREPRGRFGVILRKWKQHLRSLVDGFNEQVDRDRDRLIKKQRDKAIIEAKRKAEEDELARSQEQHYNWELSIQRIVSRPRPLAEKWHKATQNWKIPLRLSASHADGGNVVREVTRGSNHSSASGTQSRPLSLGSSSGPPPAPSRRRPPSPPVVPDGLVWDEDDVEWFLMELQRPGRRADYLAVCAETLELPVDEVRDMRDQLRREGRYRSPGR
ncbi:hypothetical protein MMYC01_210407 [Madurella mycetomatis]|uniref:Uncharacterized protein n=1 Tax=Madurella mycetomatis TaxID=100816 RepID=A0A175VQ61_9PEZI|nr:hypothetical protein MMYC01_210407 [Madurella mycetomatis]